MSSYAHTLHGEEAETSGFGPKAMRNNWRSIDSLHEVGGNKCRRERWRLHAARTSEPCASRIP